MANTPRTKNQIAGVLQFFGPHHETTAPKTANPSQIQGVCPHPKPITVPIKPANATGTKGRRIGQLVLIARILNGHPEATKKTFFLRQ